MGRSRRLAALSRMSLTEVVWRGRTGLSNACGHVRSLVTQPGWRRERLLESLDPDSVPSPLIEAVRAEKWADAHVLLSAFIADRPQRFLIAPALRTTLVSRVLADFPDARDESAARASRILAGEYDLLGYRGLRFATPRHQVDWHLDPVHRRRMPDGFWTKVPYLDPLNGDHKIIWELNRHQHWIALARAYWLTGDTRYRTRFVDELESWLAANPPLRGVNWASMLELGMRALSWTWALESFVVGNVVDEAPWTIDLLAALDRQLTHVERHLSFYFSPNTHLLGEALGLYVTGQAFSFLRASKGRVALGRRILVDEIERQIAADGSHRERSSHYHRYTLDFYLIACAVARIAGDAAAAARFGDAVGRLSAAAIALSDNNGRLAHFGDDDGGAALPICPRPLDDIRGSLAIADVLLNRRVFDAREETIWFLAHPMFSNQASPPSRGHTTSSSSTALPDLGYFVSRSPAGVHVLMHAGPHGYLNGGHAHADSLSMTVTLSDKPFLIDPGTGAYTTDARVREQFRSTKSHNTVTVDGRSQSLADGPFHWKSRAVTTVRCWHAADGFDYLEALHDGYRPAMHRRHVMSVHDDLLIVMDLVFVADRQPEAVNLRHTIASHWHVDPRWRVQLSAGRATLSLGSERVVLFAPTGQLGHFVADGRLGLGWHSPVYGRIEAGSTLRVVQTSVTPTWSISIFSLKADNPVTAVERLPPADDEQGVGEGWTSDRLGCGVRIVRQHSTDYAVVVDPAAPGVAKVGAFEGIATDARACFCRVERGRVSDVSLVGGAQVTVHGSGWNASLNSVELVS